MKYSNIKNSVKGAIKVMALVTSLLYAGSAMADTYYLVYHSGNINTPSALTDNVSCTAANEFTWTVDVVSGTNWYFTVSTSASYADMITTSSISGTNDIAESSLLSARDQSNGWVGNNQYYYYRVAFTTSTKVKITYNKSTKKFTFATAGTTYSISTNVTGGNIDPTSATVSEGSSARFTVTPTEGYDYSSHSFTSGKGSVSRDGNVFTVTPTATGGTLTVTYALRSLSVSAAVSGTGGSIAPTTSQTVSYGGSLEFTATAADASHSLDRTNVTFSGTADIAYTVTSSTVTKITLSNIQAGGTLTVAFVSEQTPMVNFGALPQQVVNNVKVDAYLAERYCSTVTAIGFEWNTSNDFTSPNDFSYSSHSSDFTLSNSRANLAALVNGDGFSANIPSSVFSSITSGTNMFFRAYVTTAEGTGYSDVVGFFYNPCQGLSRVSIVPTEVQLAAGYSVTLQAVARGAGKGPAYEWYLDATDDNIAAGTATPIEGASSDSYTFTMPSPAGSHTIKVKVTEGECSTSQFTHDAAVTSEGQIPASKKADITTCSEPSFDLSASSTTTTPWAGVTFTVANSVDYDATAYKWEVTPSSGELSGKSKTGATLRAPEGAYTVTYTASGTCNNATVNVEKSITITVDADSEVCTQ